MVGIEFSVLNPRIDNKDILALDGFEIFADERVGSVENSRFLVLVAYENIIEYLNILSRRTELK